MRPKTQSAPTEAEALAGRTLIPGSEIGTVRGRDTSNSEHTLADRPDVMAVLPSCHRPRRPTHTRGYHRQRGWLLPWRRLGKPLVELTLGLTATSATNEAFPEGNGGKRGSVVQSDDGLRSGGNLMTQGAGAFAPA